MSAQSIGVLLADDHRIVREGARRLLEDGAAQPPIRVVGEAESGPDAIKLIKELVPDVLVVDLALPGCSGIEVCRFARTLSVPVVILTMHVSAEHVRQAREAGAGAYVVKGSGVSDLAEAIVRVQAGESGPFPAVAADPIGRLTQREREVLVEVANGMCTQEIADRLRISVHTVNTHRIHLMEKLGVHDAVALTRLAFKSGLVS